jgi:hypothetical protein
MVGTGVKGSTCPRHAWLVSPDRPELPAAGDEDITEIYRGRPDSDTAGRPCGESISSTNSIPFLRDCGLVEEGICVDLGDI